MKLHLTWTQPLVQEPRAFCLRLKLQSRYDPEYLYNLYNLYNLYMAMAIQGLGEKEEAYLDNYRGRHTKYRLRFFLFY